MLGWLCVDGVVVSKTYEEGMGREGGCVGFVGKVECLVESRLENVI